MEELIEIFAKKGYKGKELEQRVFAVSILFAKIKENKRAETYFRKRLIESKENQK